MYICKYVFNNLPTRDKGENSILINTHCLLTNWKCCTVELHKKNTSRPDGVWHTKMVNIYIIVRLIVTILTILLVKVQNIADSVLQFSYHGCSGRLIEMCRYCEVTLCYIYNCSITSGLYIARSSFKTCFCK